MMGRLRPILAVAAALCGGTAGARSPFTMTGDPGARIEWSRTFASPGGDWINDLVPLRDGRVLAVGFLGREDGAENPDWRALAATLGREGGVVASREYGAGGGIDAFWSAEEDAAGRLVFAGFTSRIGAGGIDGLALTTGADFAPVRESPYGGAGYDRFTDLAPAGSGHVYIGHSQPAGEDRRRLLAVKIDGDGAVAWQRIIEGTESIAPLYIEPAGDGGFVVAGGLGRGGDSDLLAIRLDGEGRELWRRTAGTAGADDVNHGLVVRPDGRIVLLGYSRSWGARDNDILAVTLSSSGEVLRREMIGGAGDDRPILARADGDGRIWVVGYTQSAGAGGWDVIVVRLGSDGGFEPGVLTIGAAGDDHGTAILPLDPGHALVAGYSDALGGGEDAFVLRIAADAWARPHPAFTARRIP